MAEQPYWFEWDEDLPHEIEEFLAALRVEAERWPGEDPLNSQVYQWDPRFQMDDRFVLGLDVSDRDRNLIVRTLRVDYLPSGIVYGEDETGQFVTPLTPSQKEYGELDREGRSPTDLGRAAAAWFREQMVRPIEFLEWEQPDYWYHCYRLADSGRGLCWSAKGHEIRPNLGPPDRVTPVTTRANDRSAPKST